MTEQEKKWFWIVDFCKEKKWPPHQSWAWSLAEEAYFSHLYEDYDPNLPPDGQIGKCAEFHQKDNCDCGAKSDLWKTLQHDGEKFYWYLEWICHKDSSHVEDRIDPFDNEQDISPIIE